MVPPDFKLTSNMLWQGALVFALIDACVVSLLAWRVQPHVFRQLPWAVVIATAIFWGALWTAALRLAWQWFYGYIFPDWAPSVAPSFGLVYSCIGLTMWFLAWRLPGNPIVSFCRLGSLEGLVSHVWAVYNLGVIDKIPIMHGASPASVFVFAMFEKILYWSIILGVAELLRRFWQRRTKSQPGQASAV